MAEVTYPSREELALSLDVKASAYMATRLDHSCASATRAVNAFLRRKPLHPVTTTRYWDWPNNQDAGPWRVYFDDRTLISLASLVTAGVTVPSTAYNLEPNGDGPPYTHLDLLMSSSYSYAGIATTQRAIAMTGDWGYSNDEESLSTLSAAVVNTTATSVTVNAPVGGVGSLIRVDTERMIITEKSWAASGQTVVNVAGLVATTLDTTLSVTSTATFVANETLLIDTERVLVREVIDSTTMVITRGWDGTTLAVHANSTAVRRQLTLTVARGATGTTAATHAISAPVYRWVCPPLANELGLAYAEDAFLQSNSGYARTVGQGENERTAHGSGIKDLEKRIMNSELYRPGARYRAV